MTKLQASPTDFVYAVVVGAAFQQISTPLVSVKNLLLFFAFLVIIDDWVLYHAQIEKIEKGGNPRLAVWALAVDLLVLMLWYCVAVSAMACVPDAKATCACNADVGIHAAYKTSGETIPGKLYGDYYLFLALFYGATSLWEWYCFDKTRSRCRLKADLMCMVLFGLSWAYCLLAWQSCMHLCVIGWVAIIWFFCRIWPWREMVCSRGEL